MLLLDAPRHAKADKITPALWRKTEPIGRTTRLRGAVGSLRERPFAVFTLLRSAFRIGLVSGRLNELAKLADRDFGLAKIERLADNAAVLKRACWSRPPTACASRRTAASRSSSSKRSEA